MLYTTLKEMIRNASIALTPIVMIKINSRKGEVYKIGTSVRGARGVLWSVMIHRYSQPSIPPVPASGDQGY